MLTDSLRFFGVQLLNLSYMTFGSEGREQSTEAVLRLVMSPSPFPY